MLARWRQRRIAGRLVQAGFKLRQSRFQFSDPRQQQTDHGLRLRRLPSNQLFGDQQFLRHVPDVTEIANQEKTNSAPGCERYAATLRGILV
jgi:hypothetical protein